MHQQSKEALRGMQKEAIENTYKIMLKKHPEQEKILGMIKKVKLEVLG